MAFALLAINFLAVLTVRDTSVYAVVRRTAMLCLALKISIMAFFGIVQLCLLAVSIKSAVSFTRLLFAIFFSPLRFRYIQRADSSHCCHCLPYRLDRVRYSASVTVSIL